MNPRTLAVVVTVLAVWCHPNAYGWVSTTVDSVDHGGWSSSIAVDESDTVHISHVDPINVMDHILRYSTNASGSWVTLAVDSSGNVGDWSSIAVDSSGKVHISYFDATNYDLKYATNASGDWVASTLDSDGYVGYCTSIAVDSSDKVHISYAYAGRSGPKYATDASGSWEIETVDPTGGNPFYTSIALDGSDKVHICYHETKTAVDRSVKYATKTSGGWVTETVDSGFVGDLALAVDSLGKAHISYKKIVEFTPPTIDAKYATNASGVWVLDTVGSAGGAGDFISIAIDRLDKVHIAYEWDEYDDGTSTMYYALKYATNASDAWVVETVESTRDVGFIYVGFMCRIALDSLNQVHISHFDGSNIRLKYTTNIKKGGYSEVANAEASVYGDRSLTASGSFNALVLLLIPAGAVIGLRIWRRKR